MKMKKIIKCNVIMNHLQDMWDKKTINFFEEHQISPTKLKILNILDSKEKITLFEIARILNKPTSNVSPTLRKMASQGVITKEVSQSDKRIVYFVLNKKGNEILNDSNNYFEELANTLVSDETLLDKLYQTLNDYTSMVENNIEN